MSQHPTLPWQEKTIVLASKSPRRRQILEAAGIPFRIQALDVEENYPQGLALEKVAPFLARKKALAARHLIDDQEIILAADSIVLLKDEIFGKPKDRSDAIRILQALSGEVHQVITGVCLLSQENESVFSGISKVHFADLSRAEIEFYIDTYEPYDKAGSYAIQEWIGLCKIKRIEGTYSNIMGLPMELVYRELMMFE